MESFKEFLTEGINDKFIFKAVILAGGPGSGKSFITENLIAGLGVKILNSDELFELGASKAMITGDPKARVEFHKLREIRKKIEAGEAKFTGWFTDVMQEFRSGLSSIMKSRAKNWIDGMLPIIIDGTGKNYNKIESQKKFLESIGYDVSMIFVNTSLETAIKRDMKRNRTLGADIVKKLWSQVQENIGKFNHLFDGNFAVIDNNVYFEKGSKEEKEFYDRISKLSRKMIQTPIKNPIGRDVVDYLKTHKGKMYSDYVEDLDELISNFRV